MYKFILAILGFSFSGIFGAIIGYFVGSSIDRAKGYGIGGINPLSNQRRKDVFLQTLFALMGKIAKADGHISEDEISHVEHFIKNIGMTAEHRKVAIAQFKRGSDPDFDIDTALDQFLAVCGNTRNLKQMLLTYVIVIALADGAIDSAEQDLLEHIGIQLGYSRAEFEHILNMVANQTNFSGTKADSASLSNAYKALGVSKESSDQEIKRAYRKLMSQHHPDKLMGQGMPKDMIAVATERAKEIQVAYDLIKTHRDKNKH